jgi:hypothetical protein
MSAPGAASWAPSCIETCGSGTSSGNTEFIRRREPLETLTDRLTAWLLRLVATAMLFAGVSLMHFQPALLDAEQEVVPHGMNRIRLHISST